MKQGAPAEHGFELLEELGPIGRARRYSVRGGGQLWRFSADELKTVERLLSLGRSRIGGFALSGRDDEGFWVWRRPLAPTLADHIKQTRGAFPWQQALELGVSLAGVLAECEALALFPGPLSPQLTLLDEHHVELVAEPLMSTLAGAAVDPEATQGSASARWIAPEQAGGAPWDNAANRYVLGLILYRLLSGEHPYRGKGLRLGLEDASRKPPPPLPVAIAETLPPGLQSLCLRLLDPDPKQRPRRAAEVEERLTGFLHGRSAERASRPAAAQPEEAAEPASKPAVQKLAPVDSSAPVRASASRSRWLLALPVLAGALVAYLSASGDPPKPERNIAVRERPLLGAADTGAEACASCHPRQSSEWHRSVMAHSVKSPMFQALEMLIEEQVGRDFDCPEGAGILRNVDNATACRDRTSGIAVTGSGGELWCVNCHSPSYNLRPSLPAWDGRSRFSETRRPLKDLLGDKTMEGISCGFCHQVHGPVQRGNLGRGLYEGNPFWTSTSTGQRFEMRPEDSRGTFGIANSGYFLDPGVLIAEAPGADVVGGAHKKLSAQSRSYLRSSEFCGACHDVRLFGSDVLGAQKGEHFKRLRNAYSEWVEYGKEEQRRGREPASCQDCHMSSFPGVCVSDQTSKPDPDLPSALARACPKGTHFERREPGSYPQGRSATVSGSTRAVALHYFSGIDLPLTEEFPEALFDEPVVDALGVPLGARARRDLLLGAAVDLRLEDVRLLGGRLEVPLTIENVGGGHRVPAGFSQERELWVHLRVTDANDRVVYEVGRVERGDEDLHDKIFLRINTDDRFRDGQGRPLGMFGADIADGPDSPRWNPRPELGGRDFRGLGLINFQNGFLRCVVCIGRVDFEGRCQPAPGQERARADRFADGSYDIDTGECRSNLFGQNALYETYFPVGALDATRGVTKGPDAIIDTRSLPPKVPIRYTYELGLRGAARPLNVEARLLFRSFPPYLIRAFADYERRQAAEGRRPSGPLITDTALSRLEVVELKRVVTTVP